MSTMDARCKPIRGIVVVPLVGTRSSSPAESHYARPESSLRRNMPKQYIRFGIIGCGLMGREFASAAARWCHLLDFDVAPRIVGVCDTNPAMLGWFTDNIDTIRVATQDYHELLSFPPIDAIYCAVPHNLHEQFYVDIIEAGKHLLGEKPFGIDKAANAHILD